jgi:hypothetical protein
VNYGPLPPAVKYDAPGIARIRLVDLQAPLIETETRLAETFQLAKFRFSPIVTVRRG